MDERVKEKFWSSVEQTGYCWNWIGELDRNQIPVIHYKHIRYIAKHLSLEIHGKELPKYTRPHTICGNNLCVNPDHLIVGDEARFWSKIFKMKEETGGCWVWLGTENSKGYGRFTLSYDENKSTVFAHRYSWMLFTQRPIPARLVVCHKCDNPRCVNPYHLFLGTGNDNVDDRHQKGRDAKGEKHGRAKLTEADVITIRELYATGTITYLQLSRRFGVSKLVIGGIVLRKLWRHVP